MIGEQISHYNILEKLGEGGMGVVYKAEDTKLDRIVALKFLPKHLLSDRDAKNRFENEAKSASALNHPNITTIYEIDEAQGENFICMEYIEGKSVKELIEEKIFSIEQILKMAIQIGEGLHAAHKKGIVHRDIKSDNIKVTGEGLVKIMDFGLAKLRGVSRVTREGTTLGTIPYMSPEQVQGIEIDQRSDIFSYGVVLYEMITGQLPFKGEHEAAVIYSIINESPEPLARYKADVPEGLQLVTDKALAKEKNERYQHVDEMIADLRTVQQQIQPTMKIRKKAAKLPLFFGGGVIIALLIVLSYFFLLPRPATISEKSIAVLPFIDMSPQKDQEYFCDGMTEDLINRLSNVQGLKVPARTSVFTFKGKSTDIRDVGDKLKVQTVLEGSVQKSGNQLRITAQLINVADGYHLWSERYDRELQDVFVIQDEISSAIVNALQLKLTSQDVEKLSEHPIDNIKAYEYYLKADREIIRFEEKSLDSAFVYLQTAIDILGENAELYAAMAAVYSQYANIGIRQESYIDKAAEYARKALSLRPNLASALSELGTLAFYQDYPQNQYDTFIYYNKALAANPNEIRALHGMAMCYSQIGQPSKAYTFVERLEYQDPLNPRCHIARGYYYYYNCQFDLALDQFRMLYQADPTSPLAQNSYANILVFNGKNDEAIELIKQIEKTNSNNVMTLFSLLLKHALRKDTMSALQIITPDFEKTCWRDYEWSYWVANRLSLAGAKTEAMVWLENAVSRGFISYPFLQCDPFLDNLRNEAQFKKLLERAKYEWENFKVPE